MRQRQREKAEKAAANQVGHHLANMRGADSDRGRLRAAVFALLAEAFRTRRLAETLLVVLDLLDRLRTGQPLPQPHSGSHAHHVYTAVCGQPFAHGTTPERRHAA